MSQEAILSTDPIMGRLEDQIAWYDCRSLRNQRTYKQIKVIEILAAAMIPFIAAFSMPHAALVTGSLGVLITVLEGLIHLNQYQQNWTAYRSTCEALRHEKYVYLGKAAPYANTADAYALLAERIESLISQENSKWTSAQSQEGKK